QAGRWARWLAADEAPRPLDVAWSSATTRPALERRAVLAAVDRDDLVAALTSLASGDPAGTVVSGATGQRAQLALLFSGQGAQRAGMGRELAARFPVFATALDEVCAQLDPLLPRPLREVLFAEAGTPEAGLLDQTVFTQAGLFAVEVALFRLVESFGVVPDMLAGHSIGEITAAHVAGVLSLGDAAALVAARGRLMQALPAGGGMLAVAADEAAVVESIAGLTDRVGIAAVNGPAAVVVSGEVEALDAVERAWQGRGARTRRLTVSHAFHSPLMEPMLAEFRAVLDGLTFSAPLLPVVSNVTGALADPDEIRTVDYWVRHVREAVRYADGVSALRAAGVDTFLEVGPQSVLTAMAADILPDDAVLAVAAQRKDRPETHALLHALAELHVHGVPVTWQPWFTDTGARRVDLPTYAFQHQRYWPAANRARMGDVSGAGLARAEHPLLGATVDLAGDDEMVLTGRISLATHPWLADHAVSGVTLVPGTALVELAVRAGDEVGLSRLRELTVAAPLVVPGSGGVRIQVRVDGAVDSAHRTVAVYSRPDDDPEAGWTRHAEGVLESSTADEPDMVAWPPAGGSEVDLADWYPTLAEHGLAYGPVFQGLRRAWTSGGDVFAEVVLPDYAATEAARFGVHPALLDAALHPIGLLGSQESGRPRVPFAFEGVQVHASGAGVLRVRLTRNGSGVRLAAYDEAGAPVVSVDSLVLRELTGVAAPGAASRSLFELRWPTVEATPGGETSGWALLAGGREVPAELAARVRLVAYPDVAAVAGEESVPRALLLPVFPASGSAVGTPDAVRAVTSDALATVRSWLAADALADARLVVVTRGAVSVGVEDRVSDLAGAAVWGLLRSAQSEHPGRIVLADVDGDLDAALVTTLDGVLREPATTGGQLAVRRGAVYSPRLVRAGLTVTAGTPNLGDGAVLVTGGTGALGALVAEHLVSSWGVRSLVLVSRRGMEAAGAGELAQRLTASGAAVRVVACDVTDRGQVDALVADITAEGRLAGVVHTAGVLDDGVVEGLTAERLGAVLAPKVSAGWWLHEAT
ncbi:type I polyketide synthase, partial [Micromonospora sp. NPDC002717]|uniref:type I polyketide synthase n=1 Tax=Micromonospora sp. NPDC002717 TaxID=3154424 RepID=UPI0033286918